MVASAVSVQDRNRGTRSESIPPRSLGAMDTGALSVKTTKQKEQLTLGDDYALKVRKPYTITKQRERWTEEEHKKFIEALKLYGRAWRRIEDHVETKTAVQIRSHAQKFFTKVVRESASGDASSVKPIEIPPPRPKRKPMHPYPRKLTSPSKSGNPDAEKSDRSASSPSLSILEQESQSPTSVFSAVGSNSNTPNSFPSPVSSATGVHLGGTDLSAFASLLSEENRSSSSQANSSPKIDEEATEKLLAFSQDSGFSKDDSVEASSTRCLKLFGKTMLVTDSDRASTLTLGTCKAQTSDFSDGLLAQALSLNLMPSECSPSDCDSSWNGHSRGAFPSVYYMPLQKDSSPNLVTSSPWWTFSGDDSLSSVQVYYPIPVKPSPMFAQHEDSHNEGSSTGSDAESVNLEGDGDDKAEVSLGKEDEEKTFPTRSSETDFFKRKAASVKNNKGFVPYKRCLADRRTQLSSIASDERIMQRIRLSS